MKDRIREVRKSLKMTQAEFAKALGTTRTAYAKYEYGLVEPSDTTIRLVCSTFNISENWLRFGKGNMHLKSKEERLDEIAEELQLTPNQTKVFHILMGLPSEKREVIANAFFLICDENDRRRNEEQSAAIQSEQAIIQKEEETTPDEENVSV